MSYNSVLKFLADVIGDCSAAVLSNPLANRYKHAMIDHMWQYTTQYRHEKRT